MSRNPNSAWLLSSARSRGDRSAFSCEQYAEVLRGKTAPIRRVEFREGDTIKIHTGESVKVDSVENDGKLFVYLRGSTHSGDGASDTLSFSVSRGTLARGAGG